MQGYKGTVLHSVSLSKYWHIARTPITLKEAFLALESAARKTGLQINEQKAKCSAAGRSQSNREIRENTSRKGSYTF
jgi:hypothetical protein